MRNSLAMMIVFFIICSDCVANVIEINQAPSPETMTTTSDTLVDLKSRSYYVYSNRVISNGTFIDPDLDASFNELSPNNIYLAKVNVQFKHLALHDDNVSDVTLIAKSLGGDKWVVLDSALYAEYVREINKKPDLFFHIPSSLVGFKTHMQSTALLFNNDMNNLNLPLDTMTMVTYSWPAINKVNSDGFSKFVRMYELAYQSASQPQELERVVDHIYSNLHKPNLHVYCVSLGCGLVNSLARVNYKPNPKFTSLFYLAADTASHVFSENGGVYKYSINGTIRSNKHRFFDLRRMSDNTRVYYTSGDQILGYSSWKYDSKKLGKDGLEDTDGDVSDTVTSIDITEYAALDKVDPLVEDLIEQFLKDDIQASKTHMTPFWSLRSSKDRVRAMLVNSPTLVDSLKPLLFDGKYFPELETQLVKTKMLYITNDFPVRDGKRKLIKSYASHSRSKEKVSGERRRQPVTLHVGYLKAAHIDSVKNIEFDSQFKVEISSKHVRFAHANFLHDKLEGLLNQNNNDLILFIGENDFKTNAALAKRYLDKMEEVSSKTYSMLIYSPISPYAMGDDSYNYMKNMSYSSRRQTSAILESIRQALEPLSERRLSIIAPGFSGFFLEEGLKQLSVDHIDAGTTAQPFINSLLLSSSYLPLKALDKTSDDGQKTLGASLDDFMIKSGHVLNSRSGNEWRTQDKRLTFKFGCREAGYTEIFADPSWVCDEYRGYPEYYPMGLWFYRKKAVSWAASWFTTDTKKQDDRYEDFPTDVVSDDDELRHYRALSDDHLMASFTDYTSED